MELLKTASQALQRHAASVALYIVSTVVMSVVYMAVLLVLRHQDAEFVTNPSAPQRIIHVAALLAATAGWALIQTVVFSRIGRELDRPLWKVANDREALRRFFPMWFEFNLVVNTLYWVGDTISTFDSIKDAAALPQLFAYCGIVVLVPFGAAVMFHGHFKWNALGEGLAPVGRRLPQLAIVFGLTVLQIVISILSGFRPVPETIDAAFAQAMFFKVIVFAITAYLDCVVFAATWLVCKDDRDSPDEFDIDF